MRKGSLLAGGGEEDSMPDDALAVVASSAPPSASATTSINPTSSRPVRGKKGKMKKRKAKYADQSDDERELRMSILGVHYFFIFPSSSSTTESTHAAVTHTIVVQKPRWATAIEG